MPKLGGWIPEDLKGVVTFFSQYDLWDYSNINYHTCKNCIENSSTIYQGDMLRSLFPYLVILDEETIWPSVHPNCTCTMKRVTNGQDERLLEKEDLSLEYEVNVPINIDEVTQDFGGYW